MQIRWLILLSPTLARTSMAFQFLLVTALSAIYIGEVGLSYAAFGALAGVCLLPGVVAALFGGGGWARGSGTSRRRLRSSPRSLRATA